MTEITEEEKSKINSKIDDLVKRARKASEEYKSLNQEQIDRIVKAMSMAGEENHMMLAKMAIEETDRGIYEDKITKNMFATEYIYHSIKNDKTVGIINENEEEGYEEIAEPIGVIAGVTPVTNPTSTVMFKSLISAKTRNVIIFGFHPSAQNCSTKAAEILREAAIKEGAPKGAFNLCYTGSYESSGSRFDFSNWWNKHGKGSLFLWQTCFRCWPWKCSLLYKQNSQVKNFC